MSEVLCESCSNKEKYDTHGSAGFKCKASGNLLKFMFLIKSCENYSPMQSKK